MNSSLLHEWLATPIATHLALTIIHSLWEGTAVAMLVTLCMKSISGDSPSLRANIALAGIALTLAIAIATFITLQNNGNDRVYAMNASAGLHQRTADNADAAIAPINAPAVVSPLRTPHQFTSRQPVDVLPWLSVLWVTGVGLFSIGHLLGWSRLQFLVIKALPIEAAGAQVILDRLKQSLSLGRDVRLRSSSRIGVPLTLGWVRPAILLPAALLNELTLLELEAILAHELVHIRRHDYLINLLSLVAETLFFYHPAIFWLSRQVAVEREYACDDLAISTMGTADARAQYAGALAAVERFRQSQMGDFHPPVLTLAVSGGALLTRVQRILCTKKQCRRSTGSLSIIAILAIVIASLSPVSGTAQVSSTVAATHSVDAPIAAPHQNEKGRYDLVLPTEKLWHQVERTHPVALKTLLLIVNAPRDGTGITMTLTRKNDDGSTHTFRHDMAAVYRHEALDRYIQGGDVIVVEGLLPLPAGKAVEARPTPATTQSAGSIIEAPHREQSGSIYLTGVPRSGRYAVTPGMMHSTMTLTQLMMSSGQSDFIGKQVTLIRTGDDGDMTVSVDNLTPLFMRQIPDRGLQPNDVVAVEPLKVNKNDHRAEQRHCYVFGTGVPRSTPVPDKSILTLQSVASSEPRNARINCVNVYTTGQAGNRELKSFWLTDLFAKNAEAILVQPSDVIMFGEREMPMASDPEN